MAEHHASVLSNLKWLTSQAVNQPSRAKRLLPLLTQTCSLWLCEWLTLLFPKNVKRLFSSR